MGELMKRVAPKKKGEQENGTKAAVMVVRMHEDDKRRFARQAASDGLTLSRWVIKALNGACDAK